MPGHVPRRRSRLALLLAAAGLVACGDTGERVPSVGAETPTATGGLIPGTPEAGLDTWIDLIHDGLAPVPALATRDPGEARSVALDLYIGRQEYIELYFGSAGPLAGGAELDAAVDSSEARFHEVMQLIGQPTGDSATVSAAIDSLRAAHERVLELARATAPALDPRSVDTGSEDRP